MREVQSGEGILRASSEFMVDWPGPQLSELTQHSSSFTSSVSQSRFKVSSDTLFVVVTIATPKPCWKPDLNLPIQGLYLRCLSNCQVKASLQNPTTPAFQPLGISCFPLRVCVPCDAAAELSSPDSDVHLLDFVYTLSFTRNLFLWVHISIYRCVYVCMCVCIHLHMKNTFMQLAFHSTKLTCFWYDSNPFLLITSGYFLVWGNHSFFSHSPTNDLPILLWTIVQGTSCNIVLLGGAWNVLLLLVHSYARALKSVQGSLLPKKKTISDYPKGVNPTQCPLVLCACISAIAFSGVCWNF